MISYTKLLSAASVCEVFIFEGKVIFKNLNVSYQSQQFQTMPKIKLPRNYVQDFNKSPLNEMEGLDDFM